MLKLGVIGTNWITKQFVDAADHSGRFQLSAIYSRHQETGDAFAAKTRAAKVYTDLAAFLASDIAAVYIASPNSLHFAQSLQALNAGKHVIVEKPMVTRPDELDALQQAQAAHHVLLFEAARHVYDPNFAAAAAWVQQHPVTGATFNYTKYSSRYDAYLAGKNPNIFNPVFAGGALMDLGVYLVYAAVAWFGVPDKSVYLPQRLANGIDGDGVIHLTYPKFAVNLLFGKTNNSYADSEIYSGKDTLIMDSPAVLDQLAWRHDDQTQDLFQEKAANPMADEASVFGQAIETKDTAFCQQQFHLARQVHTLMYQLRRDAGVDFPSDKESL